MGKRKFLFAAAAVIAGAAVLFALSHWRDGEARARPTRPGFVQANGARFMLDGKPFRFAGANVAEIEPDDDPPIMIGTLRQPPQGGIKVLPVSARGAAQPAD